MLPKVGGKKYGLCWITHRDLHKAQYICYLKLVLQDRCYPCSCFIFFCHFDPHHPLPRLHFAVCALLTASTVMFALFSPSKYWPLLSICCQLPAEPLHPNLCFSSLLGDPVLGHGLVLTAIFLLSTPGLLLPKQGAFARLDRTLPHLHHTVKRTLEKRLSSPQWTYK